MLRRFLRPILRRGEVSILTRPEGRVLLGVKAVTLNVPLFQSSPDPKVGCYGKMPLPCTTPRLFQSSPDPKVGCYGGEGNIVDLVEGVSILTRPEGRVLLGLPSLSPRTCWFQSSPDPKVGCYASLVAFTLSSPSFNPHPTRRSGATVRFATTLHTHVMFQSSPGPEGRVLPPGLSRWPWPIRCFNPHPTRRSGATRCPCSLCRRNHEGRPYTSRDSFTPSGRSLSFTFTSYWSNEREASTPSLRFTRTRSNRACAGAFPTSLS